MTTTAIEWAQAVWNPVVGCSLKSTGCINCYAMAMAYRLQQMEIAHQADHGAAGALQHYLGLTRKSGPATSARAVWNGHVAVAPDHVWLAPLKRRKPTLYFVNSMGDLFHEDVPDEWIDRAFAVMALCRQHKFIVLTKRAERMRSYFAASNQWGRRVAPMLNDLKPSALWNGNVYQGWQEIHGKGFLPNVALGVSVENQATADERIPHLLHTPAAIRLISAEPLLGPLDLTAIQAERFVPEDHEIDWKFDCLTTGDYYWFKSHDFTEGGDGPQRDTQIDWVIAGGESGPNSRPCHPDWARDLRDQCAAAGVPFFWKQWGDWLPHRPQAGGDLGGDVRAGRVKSVNPSGRSDVENTLLTGRGGERGVRYMRRIGKAKAGALLDGQLHRAAPDGWSA